MNNIKVVVDTNVFVKAIFHRDEFSKALFELKSRNEITFVMNKEIQSELLVTFFKLLKEIVEKKTVMNIASLGALLSLSLWQVKEINHMTHTNHCEDKDDNKFVDCAIDGEVRYIITYDSHLNSISNLLKKEYNIEVLSPFQFYSKYTGNML